MLNKLAKEIHENAVAHGWYDRKRELPEMLMLCVCEAAEAVEEYRDGMPMVYHKDGKPEGIAVEIADIIIRVLDMCGYYEIDIDAIVREKVEYNKTRPYRHGGKRA